MTEHTPTPATEAGAWMAGPTDADLETAYAAWEQRVLFRHLDCPFVQHARSCFFDGWRAAIIAATGAGR